MFIFKLHAFLIKSFRALLILPTGHTFFLYNIMIKVHQHALINLVYSYMVTKVFNIQPVLFHQCYLCHLLWFKKQSLLSLKNQILRCLVDCPPSRSCWCSECSSTHEALALNVHLFTWSVKSDSCYNVPWLCSAIWSRNFGAADHAFAQVRPRFFFYFGGGGGGGGGAVIGCAITRQTAIFVAASPR